ASERNNDYFILQHSTDAVNFTDISKISAVGNSIEMTDYSFVDYDAAYGINYYRLMQVDYDGNYSVSEIIEASCSAEKLESPALTVYPSKVSEYVNIILENFYRQDVNIEIYDMLGRLVFTKSVNVEHNCQLTLDVSFLPPAMYNVRANSKDIVLTSKIIKGNL
ncbi:MAG: T9SS type A sorting domain-containing protein, partial [Bacteroidales bacterium]|nr:T9SS type A sorting domain-containing protein [Bacteroidales bacterium]